MATTWDENECRKAAALMQATTGRSSRPSPGGDLRGELARALYRGDNVIDLTYEVAPEAGEGILGLGLLLNEADAFCLAGYQISYWPRLQVGFWQIATDLRIRLGDWWRASRRTP